mmetsp:Transcript_94085/g.280791  ORF Transcript_94085/g.280791 Transcript_94085/m.280791 type:complete len:227 (+) Transcript_94085:210-890(+)
MLPSGVISTRAPVSERPEGGTKSGCHQLRPSKSSLAEREAPTAAGRSRMLLVLLTSTMGKLTRMGQPPDTVRWLGSVGSCITVVRSSCTVIHEEGMAGRGGSSSCGRQGESRPHQALSSSKPVPTCSVSPATISCMGSACKSPQGTGPPAPRFESCRGGGSLSGSLATRLASAFLDNRPDRADCLPLAATWNWTSALLSFSSIRMLPRGGSAWLLTGTPKRSAQHF